MRASRIVREPCNVRLRRGKSHRDRPCEWGQTLWRATFGLYRATCQRLGALVEARGREVTTGVADIETGVHVLGGLAMAERGAWSVAEGLGWPLLPDMFSPVPGGLLLGSANFPHRILILLFLR